MGLVGGIVAQFKIVAFFTGGQIVKSSIKGSTSRFSTIRSAVKKTLTTNLYVSEITCNHDADGIGTPV